MAEWGSVAEYVPLHYKEISQEIQEKQQFQVFEVHSSISGFPVKSIKRAYYRHRTRTDSLNPAIDKAHGNSSLTLTEEAPVIGYLLMRSELCTSDRIQGIIEFSSSL